MESVATEPEPVSATYHVFISHRGPDVKKTLASFIYHRLTNCHGLRVFLDQKELQTGDALSPAILGAIESASVHIAIFSKRYAESRWCLDELCWILRCNRKIIPVFYDVEPTDLRYIDSERGCYRKTFEEHQLKGRVGMEDIKKWKAALNKASEISGLLFKTNESDHGEVLEEIVKAVLKGVNWEPLEVGKYLVGLDPAVREIDDEIKKQRELNGTVIVGIAGMAGVGKSTLVTYLYNLKRSAFTRFCFLSDVRKKDLSSLQRKLLRDLLGCDFHVEDTRHGKGIFISRLRGLQVLIVLDDVDHIGQISNLLVTDVVGSGSLILITSRDQALLRRSSPKTVVYDVKPLQIKHAQELFCRHAFDQPEPDEGFECSVEEVLKFCGGLPLSLRVLGGLFHGRSEEEYWKRELQKLSRRLPDDIRDTLEVSYEALNSDDKEIFLDLGCFLLGEDKEVAVRVLEGLGYKYVGDSLANLRQKCLLDFQDDLQADDEIKCRTDRTSTSHEKLEIAFFTGASTISYYDTDMVVRQSITEKFKVKVADVVFPATPSAFNEGSFQFHAKMEDFQTYGGILMCFLTISCGPDVFRVRFEASNDGTSANEYTIKCGHDVRYKQKLHVFMWTEECPLFTDDKGYDTIGIYSDTMPLSKGWIIMVDKNIDVSQICKQIIIALSID